MYNVDINFLKNRPEYQSISAPVDRSSDSTTSNSNYSKTPIFAGLGIGVATLLGTGAMWFLSIQHSEALQAQQVKLDKELGAAKEQEVKLISLQSQVAIAEQESQSLAGAFNLVRPWSAIMQEFKESTPQGVQIASITQAAIPVGPAAAPTTASGVPGAAATKLAAAPPTVDGSGAASKGAPSPAPGASPAASTAPVVAAPAAPAPIDAPVTKIEVEGMAQSFNDVNSFILTLKQSPFFNPDETQLISSELVTTKSAVKTTTSGTTQSTTETTSKAVKYKIQTSLKQIPATELLRELERKGAMGIVTRLRTLQQQKVIKP
jgi:type IV pilus assembly protein PilN